METITQRIYPCGGLSKTWGEVKVMGRSNVEGENRDLDYILQALSHEVRRKIVKTLAEKSPLTYTELMKEVGIEDSGTFGFHLRRMQKFLVKDRYGGYRLSDLGLKAYRILKELEGGKPVKEVEEDKVESMVISDKLKFILSKELAEMYRNRGKRLIIADVIKLIIEPMDRELFNDVVEEIADCVVVQAPKDLEDLVYAKCRDVATIKIYGKGEDTKIKSLTSNIADTITSILTMVTDVMSGIPKVIVTLQHPEGEYTIHTIPSRPTLNLYLTNSTSRVIQKGSEILVKEYRGYEGTISMSRVDYDVKGDLVELSIENSRCNISVPKDVKNVNVELNSSSSTVELDAVEELKFKNEKGWLKLKASNIRSLRLNIVNGGVDSKLKYDTCGEFRLSSDVDGGVLRLKILKSSEVKVKVKSVEVNGFSAVKVNGVNVRNEYVEEGFEKSSSKLTIELHVYGGTAIVDIADVEGKGEIEV